MGSYSYPSRKQLKSDVFWFVKKFHNFFLLHCGNKTYLLGTDLCVVQFCLWLKTRTPASRPTTILTRMIDCSAITISKESSLKKTTWFSKNENY